MKEQRIMADPAKFSAALLTFLVMIFLIWNAFSLGHIITGIIFVLIAAVFLYIMFCAKRGKKVSLAMKMLLINIMNLKK